MKPPAGLMILAALQQQSCIEKLVGPPEQIAADAAREFRPYFPKVQAHADPRNQVILVMTCAQGLGLPFFQQIEPTVAAQLQNNPKLQQLRLAGLAAAFGQRIPYNSLVVGFEDRMLMWRRSDGAVLRLPSTPEYSRMYREGCHEGFTEHSKSVPPSSIGQHDPLECKTVRLALLEVRNSEARTGLEDIQRRRVCADAGTGGSPPLPHDTSSRQEEITLDARGCSTLERAQKEIDDPALRTSLHVMAISHGCAGSAKGQASGARSQEPEVRSQNERRASSRQIVSRLDRLAESS